MNFQVGDIAIIRNTVEISWARFINTECVIVRINPGGYNYPDICYEVRLVDGLIIGAAEVHLRKRDEDGDGKHYDGRQVVKWDDCIWKPNKVTIPIEVES